jgi:hypothetical protein
VRKIEAVDFFYLSTPEVSTEGDGTQDALVVRVAAGGVFGWGECETSPLVSIAAAFVCPISTFHFVSGIGVSTSFRIS